MPFTVTYFESEGSAYIRLTCESLATSSILCDSRRVRNHTVPSNSVFCVAIGRLSNEPPSPAVVIMQMRMSLINSPIFFKPSSPDRTFISLITTLRAFGCGNHGRGTR